MSAKVNIERTRMSESTGKNMVAAEIMEIMKVYHEQEAEGMVDTPGGLEHMGDVWSLLERWEGYIKSDDGSD